MNNDQPANAARASEVGGKVFHFNFKSGKLEPVAGEPLPLGSVLAYEDRANPRQEYVVIGYRGGDNVLLAEDGHESSVMSGSVRQRGERGGGFEHVGRVLSPAEIEDFKLNAGAQKAMNDAAEKAEKEKEAAALAAAKAKALAEGSKLGLVPMEGNALVSASKNLKRELHARFPGVKFAVKSSRFSGGDSLDVSWRNGPPYEVVDAIAQKYKSGHFNAMEDIYEYGAGAWAIVFGDAKYVSVQRSFGRDYDHDSEIHRSMKAEVMRLFEVADDQAFRARVGRWPDDEVRAALHRAAIPPGWEIRGIVRAQRDGALFKVVIGREGGAK